MAGGETKEVGGIPIRPTRKNSQGIIQRNVLPIIIADTKKVILPYGSFTTAILH
jgi:hypothetical protein